jgi:predicted small lipoprotein YifL
MCKKFVQHLSTASASLLVAGFLFLMAGCQREGELVIPPAVTNANIRLQAVNQDNRYLVFIDGAQIGDTLSATGAIFNYRIGKKQEAQRLEVKDIKGDVFIDTSLILPAPTFSVLLMQLKEGEKPLILSGNDDEPAPGADSVKWRFIYVDANLPDSIKLRYYYINVNTLESEAFDSVIVHRNNVSAYTTATQFKYSTSPWEAYWGFDIIDPFTGNMLQHLGLDASSPTLYQGIMLEINRGGVLKNKK